MRDMTRHATRVLGLAAALLVSGAAYPAAAQGDAAGFTWTKDIAPILQRSCQQCHRPDGGAPMSLITYEDTRPWARSIKARTGLRHTPDAMPPWYIEKDVGIQAYKGDVSLSDDDIAAIAKWADNGAPRGNPADAPPPLEFADASVWTIGEPDLIVSSPTFEVGASDTGLVGSGRRSGDRSFGGPLRGGRRAEGDQQPGADQGS
jgi:mono/diheme cytochrome c family protein